MPETLNQKIGSRLKRLRLQEGYSTTQLACLFNCTIEHYRRIESGRHIMSPDKFVLLRDFLGVDPLYLLTGEVRKTDSTTNPEAEPDSAAPFLLPLSEQHDLEVMKELFNYCHAMSEVG